MTNQKINEEIISVCLKHRKFFDEKINSRIPIFYDDFDTGGLLFVGMNPSDAGSGTDKITAEEKELFKWNNGKGLKEKVDEAVRVEKKFLGKSRDDAYSYFKPMWDIAKATKFGVFQHIDLFVFPETKQKSFISKVMEKEKLNRFGVDQFEIFKKCLEQIKPKIIVIANAKASDIFQERYKGECVWDETKGFHYFKKVTPIFFSGMLSGQRALDTHSRERLTWHIKKALE